MKKSFKVISRIFAGLLFVSTVFSSCNNVLADNNVVETENKNVEAEKNIKNENHGTLVLKISSEVSGKARTINPLVELDNFKCVVLTGTKDGETKKFASLKESNSKSAIQQLLESEFEVDLGLWSFTLFCSTSNYENINSYSNVYEDTVEVNIVPGTNSISFNLKESSSATYTGDGNYELTLNLPETVKYVTYKLTNEDAEGNISSYGSNNEKKIEDGKVIISGSASSAKTYILIVKMYADENSEVYLGSYSELINITYGLTSKAERTLEQVENLYSIEYDLNGGKLKEEVSVPLNYSRFSDIKKLPDADSVMKINTSGNELFFAGWYDNEELTGDPVTEIPASSIGNKKYYAKWLGYCTLSYTGDIFESKQVPCDSYISLDLLMPTKEYENYSIIADKISLDGEPLTDPLYVTGDFTVSVVNYYYYCDFNKLADVYALLTEAGKYKIRIKNSDNSTLLSTSWIEIRKALTTENPVADVILDLSDFKTFNTGNSGIRDLPSQAMKEVIFSDETTAVGSSMFYNATSLEKVHLPDSLKTLPSSLFYGCSSLKEIVIPPSVTSIENYSLYNCENLEKLTIPASLTSVSSYGLSNINIKELYLSDMDVYLKLPIAVPTSSEGVKVYLNGELVTSLDIGADVETIDKGKFANWVDLLEVNISDGVKTINFNAFKNCKNLKKVIIPNSVKDIGRDILAGCSALEELSIPFAGARSAYSDNDKILGYYTFGETEYDNSYKADHYKSNSTSRSYSSYVPNNLKKISITGDYTISAGALSGLTSVEEIKIKAVGPIPIALCSGCSSLKEVVISSGATAISNNAFIGCSNLNAISIPATVTKIESKAFENCIAIDTLYIESIEDWCNITLGSYPFANSEATGKKVYLNNKLLTKLEISENTIKVPSNIFDGWECVEEITIPESVTEFGQNSFNGCTGIKRMNISSIENWCSFSFTSESYHPLYSAENVAVYVNGKLLENLVIPESVKSLSKYCFTSFGSVKNITVPASVTISTDCFVKCNSVESISVEKFCPTIFSTKEFNGSVQVKYYSGYNYIAYIPDSLKKVEITATKMENIVNTLYGCSTIEEVSLPNITSIPSDVFKDCTNIKKVNISSIEKWCEVSFGTSYGHPFYSSKAEQCELYVNNEPVEILTIPEAVTTIGDDTFYEITNIKTLNLHKDVIKIGSSAFRSCKGLKEINFNGAKPALGYYVFDNCTGLESLTIPAGTSVTTSCFRNCSNLKELILEDASNINYKHFEDEAKNCKIEKLVIKGGDSILSWSGVSSLKEVIFDKNCTVKEIPDSCFRNCNLSKIVFPDGSLSIGSDAFYGCTGLTSVYTKDSGTWFGYNFTNLNSNPLASSSGGHLYDYDGNEITDFEIPEGVTSVSAYALYGCSGVKKLTISGALSSIGKEAFKNCSSLTDINFTNDAALKGWLESISEGTSPITYSKNLNVYINGVEQTELIIPEGTTKIGSYSLRYAKNLTSIKIPDSVTEIDKYALSDCSSLEEITIPDSVTKIESYAISNCTNLKSIIIPGSVTTMEINAFYRCDNLEEVAMPLYEGLKYYLGSSSISQTYPLKKITVTGGSLGKSEYRYRTFEGCTNVTDLVLSKDITYIGNSSLYELKSLKNLTLGYLGNSKDEPCTLKNLLDSNSYSNSSNLAKVSVESGDIVESAFADLSSLSEVNLPEGITSIPNKCFQNCTSLSSYDIPETVTTIGQYAFEKCKKLRSITLPDSLTLIDDYACSNTDMWRIDLKNVTAIGYRAFYKCQSLSEVEIPETVESFKGTGGLSGHAFESTGIKKANVHTKHTGEGTFAACKLETLVCESEVIDSYAFSNLATLLNVTLTNTVEVGESAFYQSGVSNSAINKYTTWNLPETIKVVKDSGFMGALNLTSIPDSIEEVGKNAFNSTSITKIPASLKNLSEGSFEQCISLTSVKIPDGITVVPARCFRGCSRITSLDLNQVVTIENYAFYQNSMLSKLVIPSTVNEIQIDAFYNANLLANVTFASNDKWKVFNYTQNRWEKFAPLSASTSGGVKRNAEFIKQCRYYNNVGTDAYYQREKISDSEYNSIAVTAPF